MMMKRTGFVLAVCVGMVLVVQSVAEAQYGTRQRRGGGDGGAVGERYHVELGGTFWSPAPDLIISSEQFGIPGTEIDAASDLGFEEQRFRDLRLVLRPSRTFKFRLGYTPIRYDTQTTLQRTIIFNGQRYDVGLPVNSTLEWNAWRFGLEWDFIYRSRGFVGFIAEAKYTDLNVTLATPVGSLTEFTRVRVPVPTIGGIARVYPLRNLAVTGEVTGLRLTIDENEGQYLEYDINGTYNFTHNFGVRAGYRSLGVNYRVDDDRGELNLTGLYFGGLVRF
jgi:hypothetical protein